MKRFFAWLLTAALVFACAPALAVTVNDPALPDPTKYQYEATTALKFNLRKEANDNGYRMYEVPKGSIVSVIELGEEWSLLEYKGRQGYAKNKWFFKLKSSDPYKYPIYEYDMPYGIGEMRIDFNTKNMAGKKNNYNGNDLLIGQKLTVHRYNPDTDVATILVWQSYIDLPAGAVKVTPFIPYDEAEPGDLIAGYTTYQSKTYGYPRAAARRFNISVVMGRLNGTVLQPGELFSYNTIAGPYTQAGGYEIANIMGSTGIGYGGGVCQISILTRSAILGLPVLIRDWSMHTDEGSIYTTQICDATVGTSRDFTFYNVLDYAIYMDYNHDGGDEGVMNLFIYRSK